MKSDFNFFVPLDTTEIEKAAKGPIENRYDNMVLQGLASDNTEDLDGETLEPSGYIVDHFLKNGKVNFEHLAKKSPKFWIGQPIAAQVKGDKFFVKAKLWKNSEIARDAWDKIIEMKENGTDRVVGWSIEGKSIAKDPMNPKHITKALITNLALTFSPTNTNSFADIVKGTQKEDFVETEYETQDEEVPYLFEFEDKGKKMRVGKDYKVFEVISKSIDTAAVKPLTPESLDKKTKNIVVMDIKKAIDNVLSHKTLVDRCPDLLEKIKSNLINS
jgi:hypothetical protein